MLYFGLKEEIESERGRRRRSKKKNISGLEFVIGNQNRVRGSVQRQDRKLEGKKGK